jgi:hypothetical protein
MSNLANDVQTSRDNLNSSQKELTNIQESINGLQKNLNSSYLLLITTLGIAIASIVMAAYLLNILRVKKGMLEGS